nr:unnamed protein product [Callosobruchus chinensis]
MNYAITFSVSEGNDYAHMTKHLKTSECQYEPGEFLSSYFLAKKPNGKSRFILNLKELNKFIHGPHFKLENYRSLLKLLSHNSYLGNIDMKDAYYMIAVNDNYKKYLRFLFKDKRYQFNCLPFGLNIAPYIFTKLLKPLVTLLRKLKNMLFIICLDDINLYN